MPIPARVNLTRPHLLACLLAGTIAAMPAMGALNYDIRPNESVVGELTMTDADFNDTLLDIGRSNGFGYHDLKLSNPEIDTWIPGDGKNVQLPGKFILPSVEREGVVLNIPEMRLYFFPKPNPGETARVFTYPLGVGREGWATPYVKTQIIEKTANPSWYPPESIREEHEENDDPLPEVVEAGPDNPLGDYALRLGIPSYLIHGTNKPYGVGMRVSHGCIRLYPEDIEDLFNRVEIGTPVNIINQPYKVGMRDGVIYLEAHPYLEEDNAYYSQNSLTEVVKRVISVTPEDQYDIDWNLVRQVIAEARGVPVPIGMYIPTIKESVPLVEEVRIASETNSKADTPMTKSYNKAESVMLQLETEIDIIPEKLKRK